MANILSNYMGLVILSIIATVVLGFLIKSRKQNIITINLRFKIVAIIAIVLFYASLVFTLIASFIDLTGFQGADSTSNIIKMTVFLLTIGISMIIGTFNIYREKRRFNDLSILNYG